MSRALSRQRPGIPRAFRAFASALVTAAVTLSAPPAQAGETGVLLQAADLGRVAALAEGEVRSERIPGAAIVIGTKDQVLYRAPFGNRVLKPRALPMTADVIFDLASLTKVVATTVAVMQLVERGTMRLDDPVVRYWPEFGANGKADITVRNLLTHYSGLPADLDLSRDWSGYDTAMDMIVRESPVSAPATRYLYSDINFEVLGELVRRVSGSPLDRYSREHIFAPLGMNDTGFLPDPGLRDRIAPTEDDAEGHVHWADVHDATARGMGGVSGHAGVFSTADDLAAFARMLLGGGAVRGGARILSANSVRAMTTRQSPPDVPRARGFGWDLGGDDGYSAFPAGSYGHLGFTGTMIWIDPAADLFAIVLTNRVYPDNKGDADPLRKGVVSILAKAIARTPSPQTRP